jgi:hypothetical protein
VRHIGLTGAMSAQDRLFQKPSALARGREGVEIRSNTALKSIGLAIKRSCFPLERLIVTQPLLLSFQTIAGAGRENVSQHGPV